ncbi:MAG: type II toxin-antitoxin system TacA family antitoxin [Acidimicrobiales bacterium]
MPSTTKDDRLQIRVAPERKRLLEEAAESSHLSVSAFVLQAAEMRADEILLERQMLRLAPDAARAFAVALGQPASVNERLATALQRPRLFDWID